jgi:hypothetical protein
MRFQGDEWDARSSLLFSLDQDAEITARHLKLARAFEDASYRPWTIVDDSMVARFSDDRRSLLSFLGPFAEVDSPLEIPKLWTELESAVTSP